jgi:hypothetical protein
MALSIKDKKEWRRAKARSKTENKMLETIKRASRCYRTITPEASNGSYFSLPSGKVLSADVVFRLIDQGLLIPSGDGLFDDSQTYVVA